MKKLVLFAFLLAVLPQLSMAQSMDDDLYFVPKKEKKEKVTPVTHTADNEKEVTVITSDGKVRRVPASEAGVAVASSRQSQAASSATVRDAAGVERDVDEYNRRYTSDRDEYVADVADEERAEPAGEWVNGFEGTQQEYEYATRLIRFRSPRVAVPVSSPLYWDLVYSWSPFDWNIYVDGFYAYAFPTWSNPVWWDWHYDPWRWSYGWDWHLGWGWHDPWYHHHHHPYYWGYYPHHHHHHHGPIWAGGGGHLGGSWRDGFYYDNRRRAADRPNAVRATRGNDRGTSVASRGNGSERTSGRVVAGRNSSDAVRSTVTGRDNQAGSAAPAAGRASRNTVSRSNDSSTGRSTGSYTRSSNRNSSSSSGNVSRSSSSRSSSSSGSVSRSSSSSSSRSSGSFSSGGGSSRSSGGGGGGSRSGGGRR